MPVVFNPFTGNLDFVDGAPQVLYVDAKNTSGVPLTKGTPVYVTGNVGGSDTLQIAASDSAVPSKNPTVGLLVTDLADGDSGSVIMFGELLKVNTLAYPVNTELFVAAGGGLTATKPTTGYAQSVATVSRQHASTGSLLVWIAGRIGEASGSDTQIQFNDGGNLGGDSDLTWNKTTNVLTTKGDISLDDGGAFTTTVQCVTPTANRVISFPNATGTVGLIGGSNGNLVFNSAGAYTGVVNSSVDGSGNITLASRWISTVNGAASAPPVALTGTWFTGGTATTTKPAFLIERAGTTSNAWSTSGTGLGVNAPSGFTGNLLDLQVNGTSVARISATGSVVSSAGFTTGSTTYTLSGFDLENGIISSRATASNGFILAYNGISLGGQAPLLIGPSTPNVNGNLGAYLVSDNRNYTIAQLNGTNAQTFRLYNTFTSATDHERAKLEWASNVFRVGTEKGSGGGTARAMELQTDGITRVQISAAGNTSIPVNGDASAPPLSLNGTWFTGGTSTSTKPQFLIEPAGTTSTAWNTAGTGLGVNAPSGFTGNLLDLQVGGASRFRVNSAGNLFAADSISLTEGVVAYAFEGGSRPLILYWRTTANPRVRVYNDRIQLDKLLELSEGLLVSGLPGAPRVGMLARVTDATAPAVGSAVTGGGSAAALVWWNGAAWTVIGV